MSIHCGKGEVVKHIAIQQIDDVTYEITTCQHLSNYMYINVKDLKELKEEVEKVLKSL
mgnify:CR=1 FL=1|jgi:hypothetical protein|nr:MAG TPA: hypothetical protein [Caudoviricetes sp.]